MGQRRRAGTIRNMRFPRSLSARNPAASRDDAAAASGQTSTLNAASPSRSSAMTVEPVPASFWFVDFPTVTKPWASAEILDLQGWIASPTPIDRAWFADERLAAGVELNTEERPDVATKFGLRTLGFSAEIPVAILGSADTIDVKYISDGVTTTIVVPAKDRSGTEAEARLAKRRRITMALRCPTCHGRLIEHESAFSCQRCQSRYPIGSTSIDFLPDDVRSAFMIAETDNVSSNSYDGVAVNIINRLHDGLILDCGAGSQADYFPNVVNLEIVDYPSTDVLSVGERLPFADSSFDAVFSFAVLEHVKNPFDCAAEIVRVLKPGGLLYCQVPFLQPVHAYPNHFYNMTSQGLRTLFSSLRVEHDGTFPFGQPIFAISWMLSVYAASLPADIAERFRSMTVEELMRPGVDHLGADFVTQLPDEAKDVLSTCNYVLAVKPD
jgi:SAM-dependent methyltransferase